MAELQYLVFENTAKRLLISQYQQPNFQSLMKIISNGFQDRQNSNFELRDKFWLEDATGEQLDFIGKLWNTNRDGQVDGDYRVKIYEAIERTASGTIPEIKSTLLTSYGATYVNYIPIYPAAYLIETDAVISQLEIETISPSGVGIFFYDPDEEGNEWYSRHGLKDPKDVRTWFVNHSYNPYAQHLASNTDFYADHDELLYNFHNGKLIAKHSAGKKQINIATIDGGSWDSISGEQITTIGYYH